MSAAQTGHHILVVEDDRDISDSVREVLEDEGYTVAVAGDGAEALQHLHGGSPPPDIILLDLMMPNMNGSEFRAEQLKMSAYARIPVAIISADAEAGKKASALAAAGWIRKPVKIKALLELVAEILGSAATRADSP